MRIIHLEDSVDKHMEICRELRKIGGMDVICTIQSNGEKLPIRKLVSV